MALVLVDAAIAPRDHAALRILCNVAATLWKKGWRVCVGLRQLHAVRHALRDTTRRQ